MKAKLTLEDGRTIELELTPEQEKAMEVKNVGRWKPENLETYYYDNGAEVDSNEWTNDKVEIGLLETGEVYKTEEEAQFARDRKVFITKVNDRIDELNDGWVADYNKDIYGIYTTCGILAISETSHMNGGKLLKYMKSRQIAEQIISEFKDDLMKYIFN